MMEDFFESLNKLFNWIGLFLSPFLFFGVMGWLVKKNYSEWLGITMIILGAILGIILAEYVRRKNDLLDYSSKLSNTPDIDKWLEEEREKYKNNVK